MRDVVIDAIIIVMLAVVIVGQMSRLSTHDTKLHDVDAFMKKGGRNTAAQGLALCERINILEFKVDDTTQLTDCDEIYQ